ncbi:MAG: methyltransferase domain-containing protein [Pseudomonadota bacterium]|nr:methyltransferase domain-containing protein [Pseudomonadota bacterium]
MPIFRHHQLTRRLSAERIDDWFATPVGRDVISAEQALIDEVLPDCWGRALVELSVLRNGLSYAAAPVQQRLRAVAVSDPGPGPRLLVDPESLPFAPDSVDHLVLHHVLEYADSPHQVLREAVQALVPGGRLLVLGFNPMSLWGLSKWFARNRSIPWSGRFLPAHTLADWTSLLGCPLEGVVYGLYKPPLRNRQWLPKSTLLRAMAQRNNWPVGGVYLAVVRKQRAALTLERRRRKRPRLAVINFPEPALGRVEREPGPHGS